MRDDDILAAIARREKSPASVWIYGSRAANIETISSDVDVLVYVPNVSTPYKVDEIIDHIPVSLNFFGSSSIYQIEVQREEGLYFVTRFLSPTRLIYSLPSVGAAIETDALKSIIYWLSEACEEYRQDSISSSELLLKLCYSFKVSMNYSYLPYFSALFHSKYFPIFWSYKLRLLDKIAELKETTLPNPIPDKFEKRLLREELSINFWIYSQSIRHRDSNHIKLYHEKVRRKYLRDRAATQDAIEFLELLVLDGR